MKYKITALLIIVLSACCHDVLGQLDDNEIKHRRVRVGFFAGPVNYIGDYNPSLFGSDVAINDESSIPTENFSGDLDFGFWTKIMIKEYLYIRGNAGFGTLTFNIDELDHKMNTSYKNFGLGIEASIFNQKKLRPYVTAGISTFNFTVPLANTDEEFEPFSVSEQGSNKSGMAIPVGLGVDYKLSRLTTIFFETNLTITDRDDLDNIALPSARTDAPFTNDAFISYRFGIGFSAIELFKLAFSSKEVKETEPVTLFTPVYDDTLAYNKLDPKGFIPQDSIEADKRRFFPEYFDIEEPDIAREVTDITNESDDQANEDQQDESDDTTEESDTGVIRSFDDGTLDSNNYVDQQLQRIEQLRNRAIRSAEENNETNIEEAFSYVPRITREPFIVYKQPDSIVVTNRPPPGYYILGYTSVGPQTTADARKEIFNAVQYKIAAADQRVFITKRGKFYEVRVGVFKNYEDARKAVDFVRGTFFDAYIMFYAKD